MAEQFAAKAGVERLYQRDIASTLRENATCMALRGLVSLKELYIFKIQGFDDAILQACSGVFNYVGSRLEVLRIEFYEETEVMLRMPAT